MLEATFVFALLTVLFEAALVIKMHQKTRMHVLRYPALITGAFFVFNLIIHFGTVVGTMTAVCAGLASMAATSVLRWWFGWFDGRYYIAGKRGFTTRELGFDTDIRVTPTRVYH